MTALRSPIRAAATAAIWFVVSAHALAQHPQPAELLAEAKAATGGAAWDALRSQHSRVNIKAGDLRGSGERWASITTGRSLLRYEIGPLTGLQGFDGLTVWSQDASGETRIESDRDARELAANAAYRDRLAFWFPERQAAAIAYARRDRADGIDYDVVRLTPEGGRAYEVWIDMLTHRIARLVEPEGVATRTEIYSDFRAVQGVTLPFRVRTTRGDPRHDEEYTIETIEYNVALDGIEFGAPPPPPADVVFVAGRDSIDVPMQVRNGHMFIDVQLNGKGPFHMLFDAGGASVLLPSAVAALGLKPQRAGGADGLSIVAVERLEVGGIDFEQQQFAAIDLGSVMRRVEGVDNVAGIIGFGLVARLPTRIDYERQLLTFYRPRMFKPPTDAARVPFVFDRNMPQIRARVDGLDGAFDIDTGSRASLTLSTPFVRANDLAVRYGATREVVSGAGASGHSRALLARAGKLSFGGFDVDAPVTYLARAESGPFADSAVAGNIGYGVLRRFAITFDHARQLLYFEKSASFGQPDAHDRAGLWLERGERGFDVVDVVADSPAHAAGVVAGDVIVAVNGKPAKSISLSELRSQLRGAPGTKVRFTLARKGAKEAQIVLRDLV